MTKPASLLLVALLLSACGSSPPPSSVPPVTASPPRESAPRTAASGAAAEKPLVYAGHGADSVPPEVIAKFAPPALPGDVSRRIQAMLDVRAPIAARLAPDGKSLYFAWTATGTAQIWKVDGPRRFPIQLTGGEDVTRTAALTADGKWLVVSRDRKGEENPGLYLLSVDGGALKAIQHKPKVQTQFQVQSDDGKALYFRANDVKTDSYAIYKYDLATGTRSLVFGEDGLWTAEDHLAGGKLLLAKSTGALTREYFEFDEAQKKLTPLFGQNEKEEYEALYAGIPGELIVRTAKLGEARRLYRVVVKDLKGGPLEAAQTKAITPESKFDVAGFHVDRAKKNLYWTLNEGGYTRPHVFDAKTYAEKQLPKLEGEDHVTFGFPSWDGRYVPINASSAKHPTVSSVWDWQEKKLVQWVVPSTPEIDTQKFAVPALEHYTARDGTKIPMFVRRPPADVCKASPCPVVVHFHGGPEGQAVSGMSTYGQVFVDAGFVWIEPNVRGSDGYGKTWLHADDGAKRLQVITDIEDAAKHVRSTFPGVKVGVFGGSYGGYSTLVAMTKFAGAFDAGVAVVGMSSLLTFLQNTAPYRRALRISEYGDPEKDKATLLDLSPITHIDKVNAPLLLIQGASDPRVPIGEALQMHAALEKRGKTTKMIVFPDEGHGAQKRENKVLEIGHTLDWFEVHLKGKKH
jgi:dipeptidyl aminopeptidase/acylaminoacyl peptidase